MLALAGCGPGSHEAVAPIHPAPRRSSVPAELVELIPSSAEAVTVLRPRVLVESPSARRVLFAIVPPGELDRLAQRTGVDLREVDELVLAEVGGGWLALVRGSFPAPQVVRAAAARMAPVEVRSETPYRRRAGYLRGRYRDVTAVAADTLLVADRAPEAVAAVLARLRHGRWPSGRRSALGGADERALLQALGPAPLTYFVPKAEPPPGTAGAALLLARLRSAAVATHPGGADGIRFEVRLRGTFPPSAPDNFRALARSVAETELGRALGLAGALPSLEVTVREPTCVLRFTAPARPLARGVRLLFVAEIAEALGLGRGEPERAPRPVP